MDVDTDGEMHDINVTPFIDAMLVLLIIFHGRRAAGNGRYPGGFTQLHRRASTSA